MESIQILISLIFVVIALTATAMPANPGTPVKKIPFANQIEGWEVLDNKRIIVSRSALENYLVTLRRECHQLGFTHTVGISSSNNTVYAGFDHLTVKGQRCSIRSINEITPAQKDILTRL